MMLRVLGPWYMRRVCVGTLVLRGLLLMGRWECGGRGSRLGWLLVLLLLLLMGRLMLLLLLLWVLLGMVWMSLVLRMIRFCGRLDLIPSYVLRHIAIDGLVAGREASVDRHRLSSVRWVSE